MFPCRRALRASLQLAWSLAAVGCHMHGSDDGVSRAPHALGFASAAFFPTHHHVVPPTADDWAWAYYQQAGGVALGDVDGDGAEDLFASGGVGPHSLFRNNGDGTFADWSHVLPSVVGFVSSATFADIDGDGDDDLLLSHLLASRGLTLWRNDEGVFVDVTEEAGLGGFVTEAAWSVTFADVDHDQDLDFFVAQWLHWTTPEPIVSPHVFCNDGRGAFRDCSAWSGLNPYFSEQVDASFTATFADLDEDGAPDLLLAADYGRSRIFRGLGDGRFGDFATSSVLSIDLGMGSVVDDFDADGHLDWFVTAVHFPVGGGNDKGNRLMLGDGTGRLVDVTSTSGAGDGGWG